MCLKDSICFQFAMGKTHGDVFAAVCLENTFLIGPGKNKMICDKLLDYKWLEVVDRSEVWVNCLV